MVIRVEDKSLVGLVSFGGAVHGSCGGKGSLGDDLAESNGLVILGDCVFMPHADHDLFGSKDNLFWECLGVSCAHFVVGDQLLVDSFGPSLGDLVIGRNGRSC